MALIYGVDIQKSDKFFIFVKSVMRYFTFGYLAKNTVFHKYIIANYVKIPFMQKYGELLRTLLEKKGISILAEADIFLNPDYQRDFHDPFLMKDMEKACVRIFEAIE